MTAVLRGLQRLALPATVCAAAAAAGLPAASQTSGTNLTGFFSQSFGASQEIGDTNDDRYRGQSRTTVGINADGGTETTRYNSRVGLSALLRTDRDDTKVYDVLLPDVSASLQHSLPRGSLNAGFSVLPRFLSERRFSEEITIDPEGDPVSGVDDRTRTIDPLEITILGRVGGSWSLDPRNRLSFGADLRVREYDETTPDIQPNRNYGANLGFSHALDSRSSVGLSGSVRRFETDRTDQDDNTTTSLSANASRRFTPRHDGAASFGVSFNDIDSATPDLIGSLSATYRTASTTARVSVAQDVTQNTRGEVNSTLQFRSSLSTRINEVSALSASSSLAFDSPLADDNDDTMRFNITAQYEYRVTEDWIVTTGYGFRLEADAGDSFSDAAGTNRVFLSFSRRFSF